MESPYPKWEKLSVPKGKERVLKVTELPPPINTCEFATHSYLIEHNVDFDSMVLNSGVYPVKGGLCFLLTNNKGKLAYSIRRIPAPEYGQRFVGAEGVRLDDCVFHTKRPEWWDDEHYRRDGCEVVIVEGLTDALAVWESRFDAISILGTNLTEERAETLRSLVQSYPQGRAVYIPDNDAPGLSAIQRFVRYGIKAAVRFLPSEAKDICSLTREERDLFLQGLWD